MQTFEVGFQGEPGAFSESAALELLGDVRTRGYATFESLVRAVKEGQVPYGLLPCANMIAGPIVPAYDLLIEHRGVSIVDETAAHIEQCLVGVPGSTIEQLQYVTSHPVALEQCRRFLAAHPRIESRVGEDTAGAIRAVMDAGDPCAAAIGPALAAQRYGGSILRRGVQDDADNITRFFVISARHGARRRLRRACIALCLPPERMYETAAILGERGLNVRSLIPRPNAQSNSEYGFCVEIDAPADVQLEPIIQALDPRALLLGRY
jgi:prephenate dehydratase